MEFIYEKRDKLSKIFCKNIISTFDKSSKKIEIREISSF